MKNSLLLVLICGTGTVAAVEPLSQLSLTEHASGHWCVQARAGEVALTLLVDSAASNSAIYPSLLERVDLGEPVGQVPVHGATGQTSMSLYQVPEIRLGALTLPSSRQPLLSAHEPMAGEDGIDGIVGVDRLSSYVVEFDYGAEQLRLWDALPEAGFDAEAAIPARRQFMALLVVPVRIGEVEIVGLVDTGARRSIMNWAAARALGVDENAPGLRDAEPARGATLHSTTTHSHAFDPLRMGSTEFAAKDYDIADLPVFAMLGMADGPSMVIGSDVWAQGRLTIDYRGDRIFVERAVD